MHNENHMLHRERRSGAFSTQYLEEKVFLLVAAVVVDHELINAVRRVQSKVVVENKTRTFEIG